ncbi:MAG: SUMF1/EgtB/PvdO family nonheme iron enzyme [Alphaproteobacteria bacterium]
MTTETERHLALARQQILAANAAIARIADAGWQVLEPGCRRPGLSITRSKGPEGAITCERCRELQWIVFAPTRPNDDLPACASGLVGLARYPVTGEEMMRCESSGICRGRDWFAVNDKTPVTYTVWQDVEEYIAWVNEELVLQGFRARLPRTAELIAAAGSSAPQSGGRERNIRDLHTTESGIAILPSTMREWTQDCGEHLADGTCGARKTFAVKREGRPSVPQSERYPYEGTAFRIVVERIIPTPFKAVAAARTQSR